jgi:hypothetical protein
MGSSKRLGTGNSFVVGLGGLGRVDRTPGQFWSMCPISDSVEMEMWWHVHCDVNPCHLLR